MITDKNKRFVDLACKIAEKSTSKFRLGCVIVKKNRIVSVGFNSMEKTHPLSATFGNYLHSEIRALISTPKEDLRDSTAYVMRIKKDGSLGSSKPCSVCYEALKLANVKRIYYIDSDCVTCEEILK